MEKTIPKSQTQIEANNFCNKLVPLPHIERTSSAFKYISLILHTQQYISEEQQ